uniref:L3MBTL histone methyl-lysine binding protein 3 n=1 Tax=Canis lupus dingo TaxID=286419 RepID=A0A8C0LE96_CANLU
MTESASSASGQEFDVFSVMDWKDGVGTLPGSDLKFRVNEFGALEVITDESEMENVKKATATTTWMVPTAQEVFSEKTGMPFRLKDPVKVEGLQFCENCCQYGNVDECLSGGNYCSQNCARHIKDKDQKEERDIGEDNEEEDPKCSRKKKPKLSLKADSKEDGEDRDDEMENKQDGRILRGSQRARRKRRGDSAVLKQGVPPKGKKAWCWASYLEEEKAVAVPAKLFKEYQSFPYNKNGFKVGMKLEGVDPEHQSVYCVLTVAEVCGYRIKLHFDGYSDCYDFWVNADALDIHPVGWCEKTGHKLHPPKGYKEEEFNWQTYLKTCKAQAAPKSLFENQNITVIPSGFRVGMKLEAVDKKNPAFICVATVTDMVDNRFLVHFDNWDESYDYWCEASSPHIHPVGWCKEHRRTLITPPGYPNVKHFSWDKYLEETNSLPAPARAFKVKPPHGFQKKMKLEVIDKRNPVFIRVATVADTDDHRIKVSVPRWGFVWSVASRRAPRGGLLLPRPGPLSLSVCLLMNKCWGKKKLGCMNPIFDSSHVRRGLCRVWRGHWGAMSRAPPPLSQRRCPDAPAQGPSPSSPETVSPAAATCSVMRAGVAFRSPWRLRLDRGSLGLEALPEGRWGRGCRALPRLASAP